jgi:hypothetical protein
MLVSLYFLEFHLEYVVSRVEADPLGSERVLDCGLVDQVMRLVRLYQFLSRVRLD